MNSTPSIQLLPCCEVCWEMEITFVVIRTTSQTFSQCLEKTSAAFYTFFQNFIKNTRVKLKIHDRVKQYEKYFYIS